MIRNEYSQYDIMYLTQPTRNIMRVLGIWPSTDEKKSLCEKILNFFSIILSYVIIVCDLVPVFLFWWKQNDVNIRIQMIPYIIYEFLSAGQYGIFILRNNMIRKCLKHVEEDWKNIASADIRNLMLKFAKLGKRVVLVCATLMFGSAILFRSVVALSQGVIVTEQNTTIRPLTCPSYLPFVDVQSTPIYEATFTIQFLGGVLAAAVITCCCGLTAIFVVHVSGQLKIMRNLMTKLVEKQKDNKVDERLVEIIEHHIRIRSFLRLVQHAMQHIFLLEIAMNAIVICLLIIEWPSSNTTGKTVYFLCIATFTLHTFMFCYTGDQLTVQAEKVAIVSCNLQWYRLPQKRARYVVLLILMSNAPTKVGVAGNFFDLSLRTFADVMKTIVAYINILRSVTY